MTIITKKLHLNTKGNTDIIDITTEVERRLAETKLNAGMVTVFVTHSTAGVTTIESEPGLLADFRRAWERIAPRDTAYEHDREPGEDNGYAHVRASVLGPSLAVPFADSSLSLGTWQQIVVVDFDNRPRSRTVILQFTGD